MTSLAETIESIRSNIDEADERFVADEELTRWVNKAVEDIARRIEYYQTSSTIAVTANLQQYALPTNIVRVHRMEFVPTGQSQTYTLEYRDFNNMDEVWWTRKTSATGSYPNFYTIWGPSNSANITLFPTPAVAGTLTVYYYAFPARVSNPGDTINLPQGWDDLLTHYAEFRTLRKARDPRWQEAKGLYEESLSNMYDLTRRLAEASGSIVGRSGPIPSWLWDG